MPQKSYNIPEETPQIVSEPAVAYRRDGACRDGACRDAACRDAACHVSTEISSSNQWNPNVPFHGTQEEWWEHFHRIEEGAFYPAFEVHQRISKWLDLQKT